MSFRVGDEVKIASDSEYYVGVSRYDPKDVVGTVSHIYRGTHSFLYKVMWANGYYNSYRVFDLVRA